MCWVKGILRQKRCTGSRRWHILGTSSCFGCSGRKKKELGSSHCGSAERNLTSIHDDVGPIPGPAQWVKDPVLLWLWDRPGAAAPIRPLAWEPPSAAGLVPLPLQKKKRFGEQAAICLKVNEGSLSLQGKQTTYVLVANDDSSFHVKILRVLEDLYLLL